MFHLALLLALFGGSGPNPSCPSGQSDPCAVTIVRSTIYEETLWAATDLLPGGVSAVFLGVPVPSMLGADTADLLLADIQIPALHQPVTAPVEQILLNEVSLEPQKIDGELYDFTITLNPNKPSLGRITVLQTSADDHGPAPEGVYFRRQAIEFIATLIPVDGDPPIALEGTVYVSTPVPIPFSFDPEPNVLLKTGPVGDATANRHTNLSPGQRDIFTLPSLGQGMVREPTTCCRVDVVGTTTARGGGKAAATFAINGDRCPFDPTKLQPGYCGCGIADADVNGNEVPDCYENVCGFNAFFQTFTGTCCLRGSSQPCPCVPERCSAPSQILTDGFESEDTLPWMSEPRL